MQNSNTNKQSKVMLVITTETGLLVALLYYLTKLQYKYQAHFILLKQKKERFQGIDLESLPGRYDIFNDELNTSIVNPDKSFQRVLSETNVDEIVFQNPQNFITNIIINSYKANNPGLFLTVVSDGLLLSSPINTKRKMILNLKLYYRKFINQVKKLPRSVLEYKSILKSIDQLIAHEDIGAKQFLKVDDLFQNIRPYQKEVESVFYFNLLGFERADIIFFTQPILDIKFSTEVKNNYLKTLAALCNYAKKEKINIVFKIHPSETYTTYEHYENSFIKIDKNKNIPAEILFEFIKNKIIVSMFSSVSLGNKNKSLTHYWLYKIINHHLAKVKGLEHVLVPLNLLEFEQSLKRRI